MMGIFSRKSAPVLTIESALSVGVAQLSEEGIAAKVEWVRGLSDVDAYYTFQAVKDQFNWYGHVTERHEIAPAIEFYDKSLNPKLYAIQEEWMRFDRAQLSDPEAVKLYDYLVEVLPSIAVLNNMHCSTVGDSNGVRRQGKQSLDLSDWSVTTALFDCHKGLERLYGQKLLASLDVSHVSSCGGDDHFNIYPETEWAIDNLHRVVERLDGFRLTLDQLSYAHNVEEVLLPDLNRMFRTISDSTIGSYFLEMQALVGLAEEATSKLKAIIVDCQPKAAPSAIIYQEPVFPW